MSTPDLNEISAIFINHLFRLDTFEAIHGAPSPLLGGPGTFVLDLDGKRLFGPKTTDPIDPWGGGTPLTGADGRDPEFRASSGYLQVRLTGETEWQNLLPITDLPEGPPGPTPVISIGTVTTGAAGDPAAASFGGTAEEPVLNLTLPRGATGNTGAAAWTPVIANVADGARRVQQIVDWVGGGGAKPATGKYLGPTGLVDTAAEATDVRGAGGAGSGDMMAANNLSELTDVGAARTKLDVYSKAATDTALGGKQDKSEKGAAYGYAGLGADGKVLVAQIPAVAITDTFPVASQAAMLALAAQVGDVAIRSDLSKSFILQAEPAATLANWKELLTPTVVVPVFATVAEVWTGSVTDKIVSPSVLNAAMEPQALTPTTGSITPDFHNGINFKVTATGNITFANPTNKKDGRSFSITVTLPNATTTTSFGSEWKRSPGSPAVPTAANAKFDLVCRSSGTEIHYSVVVLG